MSINQHIEELTDQYLRGDLSGAELRSFEDLMASDPVVQEHMDFQRELVKGLADHRKMQLKSRLDAIEVGAGTFGSGFAIEGVAKIAGGAVVATLVGTGIYFMLPESSDELSTEDKVEIVVGETTSAFDKVDVPSMPIPLVSVNGESDAGGEMKPSVVSSSARVVIKPEDTANESNPTKENVKEEKSPDFIPQVSVPELSEVSDEKEFVSKDISIPEVSDNDIVGEKNLDPVDIKTFNRKSAEIRYKYFEGKLFLYGDFKKEPYEILEINSKAARQIYLYYSDQYYKVEMSDEIKALAPIKSQKLIDELKIIRENKLN
ncbi:MAG: hypothetical protein ABJG41_11140 [Cyclobacteriaceae bacterium]